MFNAKATAERRLRAWKGQVTRRTNTLKAYERAYGKPEWTGERTPEWDAWISIVNDISRAETRVRNLQALLAAECSNYSSRNIAFDSDGDLRIDGDWICDLNCNGQELCLDCAAKLLLDGHLNPDDCHGYLLYVDSPEYSVFCFECNKELYHVEEEEDDDNEALQG